MAYLLALDQGTSSSRSILFDHLGNLIASAQQEFTQYFPLTGLFEHLMDGGELALPDFHCVMFDPSSKRKILGKFLLC